MLSYILSSLHQLRINALLRVELDRIGTSLPAGGLGAMGIASVIVFMGTGFIRLVSLIKSLSRAQQTLCFACNVGCLKLNSN